MFITRLSALPTRHYFYEIWLYSWSHACVSSFVCRLFCTLWQHRSNGIQLSKSTNALSTELFCASRYTLMSWCRRRSMSLCRCLLFDTFDAGRFTCQLVSNVRSERESNRLQVIHFSTIYQQIRGRRHKPNRNYTWKTDWTHNQITWFHPMRSYYIIHWLCLPLMPSAALPCKGHKSRTGSH